MAQDDVRKLRDDTEELRERGRRAAAKGREGARATANDMREEFTDDHGDPLVDMAERSGRMLRDATRKGERWMRETQHDVDERIRERPLIAVVGAFAAGILLAKLMRE